MSDTPQADDWFRAADGKWYPPPGNRPHRRAAPIRRKTWPLVLGVGLIAGIVGGTAAFLIRQSAESNDEVGESVAPATVEPQATASTTAGPELTAAPAAPAPQTTAAPAPQTTAAPAPQTTPEPVDRCQLPERAYTGVGIGFPRSPDRLSAIGTVRATVLFVDFPDVAADRTTSAVLDILAPAAPDFYRDNSYGRMDLVLEPHPVWLRMSQTADTYATAITDSDRHRQWLQEAIDLADPDVDFANADIVILVATPNATSIGYGPTWTGARDQLTLNADGAEITNGITSGADLLSWGGTWLNHEMGHSMSLVDLYSYDDPTGFTAPFSLMDDIAGQAPEFLAYERWFLGWLDDSQIACRTGPARLALDPIERAGNTKAAIVPVSETRAVVIESRRALGWDAGLTREGVLVYVVDTSIASGHGPIEVANERQPLLAGESITVDGVTVVVVSGDENGDVIDIML